MFLATTAIREFWDTSQEILFLGEWCKLPTARDFWADLPHHTLPFIWESPEKTLAAMEYCSEVFEACLEELYPILNSRNGLHKEKKYYRLILGVWLFHFIHQLYDKYLCLKTADKAFPGLKTFVLPIDQHRIPIDDWSFFEMIVNDEYSLQIYSDLLQVLKPSCCLIPRKLAHPSPQNLCWSFSSGKRSVKRAIAYAILNSLSRVRGGFRLGRSITLSRVWLKVFDMVKISLRTGLSCRYDDFEYSFSIPFEIDREFRARPLQLRGDEFQQALSAIILRHVPAAHIEAFPSFRSKVLSFPIEKTRSYLSFNGLQLSQVYKLFLAERRDEIRILEMQHGGGYGIDRRNEYESFELSVVDRFYTTGWKHRSKTRPLSNPKYLYLPHVDFMKNQLVLLAINEMPRYVYRLHFYPMATSYHIVHLANIERFLSHFQYREAIFMRSFPPKVYGWATEERLKKAFPEILVDDLSQTFRERLTQARCYVSSGMNTTYLEALKANVPTILFVDPREYCFHDSAQPFLEDLRKAHILHSDPLTASDHLNLVLSEIDRWWYAPETQRARKKFINRFAYCTKNWIKEWATEFSTLSEIPETEGTYDH